MFRHVSANVTGTRVHSFSGLRTSVNAPLGQVETQRPHPIQRSRFSATRSPSSVRASIWHRSKQVQHPKHISASNEAINALETASAGLGWLLSPPNMPQQHPQQQQIKSISRELVGCSTRLAASALARISSTSALFIDRPIPPWI